MSAFVKMREAVDSRLSAVNELRTLNDEIGEDGPSEEQRATLDRIHAAIDAADADVKRHLKDAEIEHRSAELDNLVGAQQDAGQRSEDDGLTPVEREARAMFLPPSDPGHKRAVDFRASAQEINAFNSRDLLAGTATDGAELVPTTLFGQLYAYLREDTSSMFNLGRQIVTSGGEAMDFPTVTSYSSAALVAEAGAISESDPQFATVSLGAYKYALAIQVSHELEADNAVAGALPWVMSQAVDGIRRGVNAHLITGTGSGQPNGVDNGSNTVTATGVTYPTGDNLMNAYHDVASGYRANAVWVFNDDTIKGIRQLKYSDGTGATNQYLWQPGLSAGQPDTILNRPVHSDDSLATIGANAKIGIFGDLSRGYLVRTVGSMRAERSVDYAFLNDLVTWRFLARFDGDIIDNNAFTVITNEAS